MDNYEFKLSNEEIINRISRGEYKEAAEIADTIDWSKVKTDNQDPLSDFRPLQDQ